ncbi:MAG TPA: hypothetical protein VE912_09690 [Bacteroidales bacterium]|nr:hypothetical protein [Bacteroidales bacterium]
MTPANYWPLGSTIQKTFTDLSSGTLYRNCGIISVNPVNGHAVIIFRRGTAFNGQSDYGKICIRHSSDGGANWEYEEVLFEENNVDLRNIAGGYDSSGRLYVFYARYIPTGLPPYQSMNYRYSDNDGSSWCNQITLSKMSNTVFSPYGHIVDIGDPSDSGDTTLYQTWFAHNSSNPAVYKLYLYKSTDSGDNFYEADTITIYSGTSLFSHPTMVNLGGGCFLVLAKINSGTKFRQFKTEDNPEGTWENLGETNFDTLTSDIAPPWLSFINYQGVGIVACYYTKRGTTPYKLNVVFGLATDLLGNDTSGWNSSTKKEVFSFPSSVTGYLSFFHPQNQFKGIGNTFEGSSVCYPKIVFTPEDDMISLFETLGL